MLVNVGSAIINENANASAPKDDAGKAPFGRLGAYRISVEGPAGLDPARRTAFPHSHSV